MDPNFVTGDEIPLEWLRSLRRNLALRFWNHT